MIEFFNTILIEPLFNLLVFFYNVLPVQDLGLAIIALTLLIKLILFPLSYKALKSQKELQKLQPQIKELQEKHKEDKEQQAKKVMELYQEHGVNPMGGCLPILVQLPILIALFHLFRSFESIELSKTLYPFITNPGTLSSSFLGLLNLTKTSAVLAVLAGALQFVQAKLSFGSQANSDVESKRSAAISQMMGKQMIYVMPAFVTLIALSFPAALPLYWAVNNLFTVGQELYIKRMYRNDDNDYNDDDDNDDDNDD